MVINMGHGFSPDVPLRRQFDSLTGLIEHCLCRGSDGSWSGTRHLDAGVSEIVKVGKQKRPTLR